MYIYITIYRETTYARNLIAHSESFPYFFLIVLNQINKSLTRILLFRTLYNNLLLLYKLYSDF